MSKQPKMKRVALKGCVIDGENVSAGDEVSIAKSDCLYCDGAGLTADPSTDEGKAAIKAIEKPKAEKKK